MVSKHLAETGCTLLAMSRRVSPAFVNKAGAVVTSDGSAVRLSNEALTTQLTINGTTAAPALVANGRYTGVDGRGGVHITNSASTPALSIAPSGGAGAGVSVTMTSGTGRALNIAGNASAPALVITGPAGVPSGQQVSIEGQTAIVGNGDQVALLCTQNALAAPKQGTARCAEFQQYVAGECLRLLQFATGASDHAMLISQAAGSAGNAVRMQGNTSANPLYVLQTGAGDAVRIEPSGAGAGLQISMGLGTGRGINVNGNTSATAIRAVAGSGQRAGDFIGQTDVTGAFTLNNGSTISFPVKYTNSVTIATAVASGLSMTQSYGRQTLTSVATAAGATESITVTMSPATLITSANASVFTSIVSYSGTLGANGYPMVSVSGIAAGTFVLRVTNTHPANALSGTLIIGMLVVN